MADEPKTMTSVAQGEPPKGEQSPRQSVTLDKAAKAAWRTNLDLHVLLVMKKHGLSKADALVQAYHEGLDGLTKRLG